MKKLLLWILPMMLLNCSCTAEKILLSVGSYNVRTPVDKAPNDWQSRSPRMISLLKNELKFDIFGIQEAKDPQLKDLRAAGYAIVGCGRDADRGGEYSAIVYDPARLTCLESRTFWLSATPDVPGSKSWQNNYPRICTYGIFQEKTSGKKFIFANTHLDHISTEAREKGAALIAHTLLEPGKNHPLILTGDFNSSPETVQIQMLQKVFRDTRSAAETTLPGPAMTFHGYAPDHPQRRLYPIDYIFVNKKVNVKTFQVVDDLREGLHASDHYPLKAELEL